VRGRAGREFDDVIWEKNMKRGSENRKNVPRKGKEKTSMKTNLTTYVSKRQAQ
jgi:hypothetical protein